METSGGKPRRTRNGDFQYEGCNGQIAQGESFGEARQSEFEARVTPLRRRAALKASTKKLEMDDARYIPPHRWRDRTPRRYPWLRLTALVIVVALITLVLTCRHT
jgi:hypothetical protein